jgi:hypothetical protein
MPDAAAPLETLADRFAHPAVRVLVRELSHLARDLERGTLAWPRIPPAQSNPTLPGLEHSEATLEQQSAGETSAVAPGDWARFARTTVGLVSAAPSAPRPPADGEPDSASLIALRLIWGAERFSELPTVMLKPPPGAFLEHVARLPAPDQQAPPAQLVRAVSERLQTQRAVIDQTASSLPVDDVQGFARIVAACRVAGQMRQEIALEDAAASYLAWARLLRADPRQLSDVSSGWWSSNERPAGRQPGRQG